MFLERICTSQYFDIVFSEFISVSVASSMAAANSLTQQGQVANSILPQPAVTNPTVYSLGSSTPNMAGPQYTAQQVAALGLQAQVDTLVFWEFL